VPHFGHSVTAAVIVAAVLVGPGQAWAQTQSLPPAGARPLPLQSPGDDSGLTAEVMYKVLVGEIALQRGEPAQAARAYIEAAKDTRNPALAKRATDIAIAARTRGLALEAARLWSELDPGAERPKQLVATLAAAGGAGSLEALGTSDLRAELERVFADSAAQGAPLGDSFLNLNRLLAHEPDKTAVLKVVDSIAKPYQNLPEAHYAVALAAFNTGLTDMTTAALAMQEIDRALALRTDWERAALLKAEILAKRSPREAIAYLELYRKSHPDAKAATATLAQFYVEQKRYGDARALFEALQASDRENLDYTFAVAALSVQMKDWTRAESLFEELKKADYGDNGAVEFYLAQIAEETGRYALAFERYSNVPDGDRAWVAKIRAAGMLAKQGKVDAARRYLADLPAVTLDQRAQVTQADAQILRDAGDSAAAYDVLAKALAAQPDQPDFLYDSAMVAEKLDKLDVAEANLRRLIELQPNNAQALNALGYTLVDRTQRIDEGLVLIERAYKLSPDDPFILDSMGWANFRAGHLEDAEKYLQLALTERPDPEIAAHLGEVLWARGERTRAQEVWQAQLKATPDNPVLLDTVRRLSP
jgi:tetratricopeptide (TPR) repeat protein